jgi:TM2 domain-containing membrane protein YozV
MMKNGEGEAMGSELQQPPAANSSAQQMMRYDANKKSLLVAYLLWFFFGLFGAHRFYLAKTTSAIILLVLGLIAWVITFVSLGFGSFVLLVPGLWALIDAFLIPGYARDYNNALIERVGASS